MSTRRGPSRSQAGEKYQCRGPPPRHPRPAASSPRRSDATEAAPSPTSAQPTLLRAPEPLVCGGAEEAQTAPAWESAHIRGGPPAPRGLRGPSASPPATTTPSGRAPQAQLGIIHWAATHKPPTHFSSPWWWWRWPQPGRQEAPEEHLPAAAKKEAKRKICALEWTRPSVPARGRQSTGSSARGGGFPAQPSSPERPCPSSHAWGSPWSSKPARWSQPRPSTSSRHSPAVPEPQAPIPAASVPQAPV